MNRGQGHVRSLISTAAETAAHGRVAPGINPGGTLFNLRVTVQSEPPRISQGRGAVERMEPAWKTDTSRCYSIKITIS